MARGATMTAPSRAQDEPVAPASDALEGVLHQLGYEAFRPGQRTAIETLLEQKRLLLVAPTGGGKSLCFQVPALRLCGPGPRFRTTLVVSPLIALMHDQVEGLRQRGVKATYLASTLASEEMSDRLYRLRRGEYQIIYAAPERLVLDGFRHTLAQLDVPLIAIDEAHCISEWGHDFRPEYLKINEVLATLPNAHVMACTATATPIVRDEILSRLGLPATTPQVVQGFARPNLALGVRDTNAIGERHAAVDETLAGAIGSGPEATGAAIIYAPTRKSAEQEAVRLKQRGYRAGAYHAGLDPNERERVQNAFLRCELDVAVATNAFGMGIDRGDVRAVVHLAPPGSMEAYYQEVGRAGRDGNPAQGLLCLSPSDVPLKRNLLRRPDFEGVRPSEAVVEHKWNLFLELMRWAESGSCRHDAILRYFGDEAEALSGCGRCDNCLALNEESGASNEEVTLVVRKALSGVARVHGRFGLMAAVQLLRGAKDPRLQRTGLANSKTFGVLAELSEAFLLALLRRCVSAGWVDFIGEERPMVVLTEAGRQVMLAHTPARLLLPPKRVTATRARSRARRPGEGSGASASDLLDPAAQDLFEALRKKRFEQAQEDKVPPYVVASDRTLRDIANLRPANMEQLNAVHGVGPAKAAKYGQLWLQTVARKGLA